MEMFLTAKSKYLVLATILSLVMANSSTSQEIIVSDWKPLGAPELVMGIHEIGPVPYRIFFTEGLEYVICLAVQPAQFFDNVFMDSLFEAVSASYDSVAYSLNCFKISITAYLTTITSNTKKYWTHVDFPSRKRKKRRYLFNTIQCL